MTLSFFMDYRCKSGLTRIMIKYSPLVFFLFFYPDIVAFSQVGTEINPAKAWDEIKKIDNDSLKIEKLFDLAYYYYDYSGDDRMADSVSDIAIRIAEKSHRPEWMLMACDRYIESNFLFNNYKKALELALQAEEVSASASPGTIFRNMNDLVSVYLAGYEYDKALEYSYKSLSFSSAAENLNWTAESYLNIGKSLEGKNQKIEAFRNYLNATELAERKKKPDLLIKCYSQLSHFYNLCKISDQAAHYKLKENDLLLKAKPVDSVALMWIQYDLQVIDLNSNNNRLNEANMQEILDFAKRRKASRLLKYEIALIRTHLIEADRIGQLYRLYKEQFPDELEKLAYSNPGLFYRLKALFCEEEKKPDSALYYFTRAELIVNEDPNRVLRSKFYDRYGQFLLRQGQKEKAIEKFLKSFELARDASYFDYMVSSTKQLASLYASKGDYKSAFSYSLLNKSLSDSLNNMSKKDQLLVLEIDHETWLRVQSAELELQSVSRRHYLQYSAILIIIISVFFVLLMLGSLKVPQWIIRMLGFFSFILLFEFIVLVADQPIHEITQGEPWKILLIKIFLIAILLPMHHWIEKRVVAFLLDPELINISRYPVRNKIREQIQKVSRK